METEMPDENMDGLTPEQEEFVLANWEVMDLITMVRELSGDPKADGRHLIGRKIRSFLTSKGFSAKTTKYKAMGPIELTEEQQEFIKQNAGRSKPLEIARILFNDPKLTPLSREFKAVYLAMMTLEKNYIKPEDEIPEEERYSPPTSIYRLIPRVNKYVSNQKNELEPIFHKDKPLTTTEQKNLRALLCYINTNGFVYQTNQYNKSVDRELFESSFIGMTWDKPDLLREEIIQYISLCSEIVLIAQMERHTQRLCQQVEEALSGDGDKKLTMTMVELMNESRDKLDKSKERQKKLIDTLIGSRRERLNKRHAANSSILNLVDAWRDEERRKELIALAKKQKVAEAEDIDKLATMSDVVALIAGLTKDEALNSI